MLGSAITNSSLPTTAPSVSTFQTTPIFCNSPSIRLACASYRAAALLSLLSVASLRLFRAFCNSDKSNAPTACFESFGAGRSARWIE